MLVIVCLFVVVIESMFHLENDVLPLDFKIKEVDEVVRWMNAQKSWTTLLVRSICILPTWLVFRYAPGYPHHTLPEGFFLQVFISTQTLILGFSGYWSGAAEYVLCLVFMFITYRQIFGYGWWSTFSVIIRLIYTVIRNDIHWCFPAQFSNGLTADKRNASIGNGIASFPTDKGSVDALDRQRSVIIAVCNLLVLTVTCTRNLF